MRGEFQNVLHQESIDVLYLSIPCAHILIKHKSTDLEHVMTEQKPVNNTGHTAMSMKTQTRRENVTKYPKLETIGQFYCGCRL